jgi:hypothetical protein
MLRLYSFDFLNNKTPGDTVSGKLHCRGEKEPLAGRIMPLSLYSVSDNEILPPANGSSPLAPTKGNNQRCYGFINKGMSRNISVALLVLLSSLALAHEGFNIVLEDAIINPYNVTVLEDTHLANEQLQTSLMIQVAKGREAAPADTTVRLRLEHSSGVIYENEVPYVGSSSSDGRSFYAYYFVTVPLSDLNVYDMRLVLNGSLGTAATTMNFQPKLAPDFRATELIPSLLILSICLAAVVMFVVSSRQPSPKRQQKGLYHA